jgi:phage internal scaffolding protein
MTNKFKSAYQPHPRHPASIRGISLAHQAMAPECDINTIMKRYERTGVLEHRNRFEATYSDFTNAPSDYQESMNAVLAAEEMFSSLPSKIRRRFHNDPGAFLDYVSNPDNLDEMIALGLATRPSEDLLGSSPPPTPSEAPKAPEKASSEPSSPSKGS